MGVLLICYAACVPAGYFLYRHFVRTNETPWTNEERFFGLISAALGPLSCIVFGVLFGGMWLHEKTEKWREREVDW